MKDSRPKRPDQVDEFSPMKAIALSLPVLVLVGVVIGPHLWNWAAQMVGVTVPNVPRVVRQSLPAFVYVVCFVTLLPCCSLAINHCAKTQGHNLVRRALLALHILTRASIFAVILLGLIFLMFRN